MPVTLLDRQDAVKSAAQAKRERDIRLGKVHGTNNVVRLFPAKPVLLESPEPVEVPSVESEPQIDPHTVVVTQVADYYGITLWDIYAGGRVRKFTRARHVAMYLDRVISRKSLLQTAKDFGRDHTTILNASRSIQKMMLNYPLVKGDVEKLTASIEEIINAQR